MGLKVKVILTVVSGTEKASTPFAMFPDLEASENANKAKSQVRLTFHGLISFVILEIQLIIT